MNKYMQSKHNIRTSPFMIGALNISPTFSYSPFAKLIVHSRQGVWCWKKMHNIFLQFIFCSSFGDPFHKRYILTTEYKIMKLEFRVAVPTVQSTYGEDFLSFISLAPRIPPWLTWDTCREKRPIAAAVCCKLVLRRKLVKNPRKLSCFMNLSDIFLSFFFFVCYYDNNICR